MGLLILIFGIALTLSFTILMLATSAAPQSKSMQQRLITIQQPVRSQKSDIAGAELEKIEQREYAVRLGNFLQHYKFSKKLQVLLVHADSGMDVGSVVLSCAGSALGCAFAA